MSRPCWRFKLLVAAEVAVIVALLAAMWPR